MRTDAGENCEEDIIGAKKARAAQIARKRRRNPSKPLGEGEAFDSIGKPHGAVSMYGGWLLLALQAVAVLGNIVGTSSRHEFRRYMFSAPSPVTGVARIMATLTGYNGPAVVALLLGIYSWKFRRNTRARQVVAVAMVLIALNTTLVLLL